jgi:hypothetical protein
MTTFTNRQRPLPLSSFSRALLPKPAHASVAPPPGAAKAHTRGHAEHLYAGMQTPCDVLPYVSIGSAFSSYLPTGPRHIGHAFILYILASYTCEGMLLSYASLILHMYLSSYASFILPAHGAAAHVHKLLQGCRRIVATVFSRPRHDLVGMHMPGVT